MLKKGETMSILKDLTAGEEMTAHINAVSAALNDTAPGTEQYDKLLDEYNKLVRLQIEDEVKEIETGEKTLSREDVARNNEETLRLKEKELEEKILARKDESRDRKIQMGLTLLQIGIGVVVPIVTTAATVTMLNKCGQFETGDDPQIWTTLTSRQVISSIAKGLGIKTK